MTSIDPNKSTRLPIERGRRLHVVVDGQPVEAYAGETIAAVLISAGQLSLKPPEPSDLPGSLFCGMGICFSCLVTIDGVPNLRACVRPVADGMVIQTGGPTHG